MFASIESSGSAPPLSFKLPRGAIQRGKVFITTERDYLREGIVEIELPTKVCIDVSWLPERDPDGSFVVSVFANYDWDDQPQQPTTVRDFADLKRLVEDLAARYSADSQ